MQKERTSQAVQTYSYDSDKEVTRKQEKDRMQKQESSEAIDFLQKERTSQAVQTYSSDSVYSDSATTSD